MIKFVKHLRGGSCKFCCYQDGDLNCKKPVKRNCNGGYFVRIKSDRPRKNRDRRLLEALLKCVDVSFFGIVMYTNNNLTKHQAKQLIAIKEAMEKGVRK